MGLIRFGVWLLLLLCAGSMARAQTVMSTEDSVRSAVNALLEALKKSNGPGLINCFTDSARLQSVDDRTGVIEVKTTPIRDFANVVSAFPTGAANERIHIDVIRIDGALAMVWAPYQFFYKGTLHHCGVDSFQLVRLGGVWKIQYIIDTRRTKGCQ